MSYTDRADCPNKKPEHFRKATVADITDPDVRGFFEEGGAYWRKSGAPKTWKRCPNECRPYLEDGVCLFHRAGHARVPVKFGLYTHGRVDHDNLGGLYVRIG